MEQKEKDPKELKQEPTPATPAAPAKKRRPLTYGITALIALVVFVALGAALRLFGGVAEVLASLQMSWLIVLRLLIMVALVVLLRSILLWALSGLRSKPSRVGTMATLFSSLIKYATILIIFCWGLSIIGVNVSTIFASIGVVALILGFGAESLVADLITGVFMLFENEYNVGDIIEVDGFRGRVQEIGIRTLSLVDSGGNIRIINNSDVKNVINRSDISSVAICDVAVSYDADLEEVEKKLEAILADIGTRRADLFPNGVEYLGVEALADSAVILRLKAVVHEKNIFSGRRALNREIKVAFDKAGISIPFPQLDVHSK